jgi:CHAD domain-containing protein
VAERRRLALERAKAAVTSDRHRQLVLRAALWLIAAEWSDKSELEAAQPSRRIGAFAEEALRDLTRQSLEGLRRFKRLDAEERGKLRGALKQLRYATEFFAGVFPEQKRPRSALLATLKALLRNLDRLKDFGVHERLRHEFMRSWTGEQGLASPQTAHKAFAMGFALGQQQLEEGACRAAVQKGGRKLSALAAA